MPGASKPHGKKEDLKLILEEYQVHIGIITGTHPLKPEAMEIGIPGGRYTHKGGVLIIAAPTASSRSIPEELITREDEISMCSCIIYPYHTADMALRLKGIYIPPSADAAIEMVSLLTDPQNQIRTDNGEIANHVSAGDFNQNR